MLNLLLNNEAVKNPISLPLLTNNFIYRRYDVMANQSISKARRICQIEGCNDIHYAKNYCMRHYAQIRKHGEILKKTAYDSNKIIIKDNIAEIILCNKKCNEVARAIVNIEDLEIVSKFTWHADKSRNTFYAKTNIFISKGKYQLTRMHHLIFGFPLNGLKIDHIDNNGLNNQRNNIRLVTHRQNQQNRISLNSSKYPGVSWDKAKKKWRSRITIDCKEKWLGYFTSEIDAFNAYKNAIHIVGEQCLPEFYEP